MLSDPAAAAWLAAGQPGVDAPPPIAGRCARCGTDGPTVTSSRIISERFTAYDAWPFGSRRLCTPCAWAYSRQPTTQPALLITTTTATEYPDRHDLTQLLAAGALPNDHAVVLPTTRRRHILAAAQWGHLAIDGLTTPWDITAAKRLTELVWIRTIIGATWKQLSQPAPPPQVLTSQTADHWTRILASWNELHPWRSVPAIWEAARILTNTSRQQRVLHDVVPEAFGRGTEAVLKRRVGQGAGEYRPGG